MRFHSVTQRFIFWFVMITLLPMLLTGYSLLHTFEQELRQTVSRQISVIADKKVDQIDQYLHEMQHVALIKAQGSTTRKAMSELSREFAWSGEKSASYRQLEASFRDYFKRFLAMTHNYDLFLVSPQGTVVYSQRHEADFVTNLFNGPYRDSGLGRVAGNAFRTLESGISAFEYYPPSSRAAAFVAVPMMQQGKVMGAFALQIDIGHVFEVLLDKTGLGDSGETVVAQLADARTALIVAPLNHDPDAALKYKIPLDNPARAAPLIHALNGERGSGFAVDYLGRPVVAAWRYLPRMGWGMVVKIDAAEVLAPYYRVRNFALAVMALVLIAALAGAVLLGRRFVVPLNGLIKGAQDLAAGKLDQRVAVKRSDELGQLAISFNSMAERLQTSHAHLEDQVEARTTELKQSVEAMRIKDVAIASSINAIAIASLDGKLMYVNQAFLDLWRIEKAEDAVGHMPFEFVEKAENAEEIIKSLQDHGYYKGVIAARLHDDTLADIEVSANMVMDSSGKPVCMMAWLADITARKRSEQELQKSEALLASLIDDMPAMVFVKRASDLCFERLNHAGETLLGFTEQELLGKSDYDFFLREQADFFTEKDRAVLSGCTLIDIPQESILTRGGETKILHTRKIGIYNKAGEPIHLLGVSIDITAQIRAEQAMRLSSERMHEAQRMAKMGNWALDVQSGKLEWSDEIFNIFELEKTSFAATYVAFLDAIHPDDRAMVNLAYTDSLKDHKPYRITHRLRMRDGRIKWVEERCETAFDSEGKPLVSLGTVQDITQQVVVQDSLRASEARYTTVVSVLAEGIVLSAQDGCVSTANKAAEDILGLTLEQMQGSQPIDPCWRAIHEDGSPFPLEEQPGAVTLRSGVSQKNIIMGVHKPDGRVTWITIQSQPIMQPGESFPSAVVVTYIDITERKNAEKLLKDTNEELEKRVEKRTQLLREAKEEAEAANASKSLFLASMSHELRTPLNAILGYAQLMQLDADLPQRFVGQAGEIIQAGDYLLNLMNDVIDLARIESGKLELQLEPVSLSEVMRVCYSYNEKAARDRIVDLKIEESCSAYQVTADQRGLMQVLNNLISNAIKYNRIGGRVNVACSRVLPHADSEYGKVRITVVDSGIGIAAENIAKLFQPFNRLGAEMSNIEGTGIGLVIARKLAAGMKGSIGVDSVFGLGSTFWLELPIDEQVQGLAAGSSRTMPRVLVAEDYVPNQIVLQLQLKSLGYDVDVVADGAIALNKWRKNIYDLILTDIDMPVLNGVDFASSVRKEELDSGKGHIPILAITATNSKSEMQRYKAAGIDEVLNKPLSMDALRKGLLRWIGNIEAGNNNAHGAQVGMSAVGDEQAVLDLRYLYQILGQVDLGQARMLIDTFLTTAAEGLSALSTVADSAILVAKEMHKQKSSARTVGALRYANLAAQLEQQTKTGKVAGIDAALMSLRAALAEVEAAAANLLESSPEHATRIADTTSLVRVSCMSALVVDDDLVVLQQVKSMLNTLGVKQVLTAINGIEAGSVMAANGSAIEVLVCDLSMPEMDGVELIRRLGKTEYKGGIILMSGAEEKIISTVNKLAVLQGVRVLGQLQKPVTAAQLAILLAHTTDLPSQEKQISSGPLVLKESITAAMAANEFSIWFQPKVDADTLQVVGLEALARWQLPSGKFIPPDSFITVAEREGLISELSQLLVSLALSEAAKLFAAGYPLKIAVNLSGTWLNDLSLPDFVLAKTTAAGLRASDVILEVTETGVMEDLTTALDVLSRLRLKGFGLSIDDFGIGYSSFEQLGRIPFTEMKLDRSFVSKGVQDAAARAILESSMDMAHKLHLATVAEGVETELDLKLVRSLGCDLIQGYLIAKPMPVKDLLVWLANENNKKRAT